MASIRNAGLLKSEIPGLRKRVKEKLTTVAQEADRYGVGIETIRRAVRGETFRDVREGLADPTPAPGPLRDNEDAEASLESLMRKVGNAPETNVEDTLNELIHRKEKKE